MPKNGHFATLPPLVLFITPLFRERYFLKIVKVKSLLFRFR